MVTDFLRRQPGPRAGPPVADRPESGPEPEIHDLDPGPDRTS
ncbi:hypothetical protein SBD_2301 [Streptomyces bottropensis ATCC 25435]|uniref:Uncharacterized protein n=1 Tax=Streptomyces bottropensis ATCC 25435 TaxID=1054862 RepID=M3FVN4_9ACTN|nr:hypothetical protein SBD_2301 [Streptomyces bottropensis ATCC 25435]